MLINITFRFNYSKRSSIKEIDFEGDGFSFASSSDGQGPFYIKWALTWGTGAKKSGRRKKSDIVLSDSFMQ